MEAKTIFINAVMGLTPHYIQGTVALDQLIDNNKEAVKLYGGGDTLQELKKLDFMVIQLLMLLEVIHQFYM